MSTLDHVKLEQSIFSVYCNVWKPFHVHICQRDKTQNLGLMVRHKQWHMILFTGIGDDVQHLQCMLESQQIVMKKFSKPSVSILYTLRFMLAAQQIGGKHVYRVRLWHLTSSPQARPLDNYSLNLYIAIDTKLHLYSSCSKQSKSFSNASSVGVDIDSINGTC